MLRVASSQNNNFFLRENVKKQKKVFFGAGNVKLYWDFDRSFLPLSHADFKKSSPKDNLFLEEYFKSFQTFFNKTKRNIEFNITTGRNLVEFNTILYTARQREFKMPLPQSLITKNGADKFLRQGDEGDFYLKHKPSPYKIRNRDEQKIQYIKGVANWEGNKIKSEIKEILSGYGFALKEPETTNNPKHYGKHTLFSNFEDKFNPADVIKIQSPWVASLRQDGDLSIHIGLPKDIQFLKDRQKISLEIQQKIINFLDKNNVKYSYSFRPQDKECGNHPSINIVPKIGNDSLSKLYDPKLALEKAFQENDLVIVAGDSSNDFEMLNPANYLESTKHKDLVLFKDNPMLMVEKMDENPILAQEFKELPFMGIIVKGKDKEDKNLNELLEFYGNTPYKKIICIEEGHLLDAIKSVIGSYSESNHEYRTKMSKDLLEQVYGK